MHTQKDPFRILGLYPNASVQEIKRAYHQLALRYHPDKIQGEEGKRKAQKLFQDLTWAYERAVQQAQAHEREQSYVYKPQNEIFMGHPQGGVFIFVHTVPGREMFIFPDVQVFADPADRADRHDRDPDQDPQDRQDPEDKGDPEEDLDPEHAGEFDCRENQNLKRASKRLFPNFLPTLLYPFYVFFGNLKNICSGFASDQSH